MVRLKVLISWLLLLLLPAVSHAVLRIEITQSGAEEDGVPIAIVPFGGSIEAAGTDISEIVNNDLARSGQFNILQRQRLPSTPVASGDVDYADWRLAEMELLVIGTVRPGSSSDLEVNYELIDVVSQQVVKGASYPIDRSQVRLMGHVIANEIYQHVTGSPGIFDTQFVYISRGDFQGGKTFTLQLADIDGLNDIPVLRIASPIMSPAWSADGRRLAYVSFEFPGRSAIIVHDLATAERRKLIAREGVNGAPAWSPDGRRLAITLSDQGSPDVFIIDVNSGQISQFTNAASIETEPEWLDDNTIVFTSNRSGSPQIYSKRVGTNGKAKRLTFEGTYNAAASASPDGSSIAFIHGNDGKFQIALLDIKSKLLQVLTDGTQDESPSFAPNGQMILYAAGENGRGVLGLVSVDGTISQRISLAGEHVHDPAWGPFRQ